MGMIGRWSSKPAVEEVEEPKGFDAFELRLGDIMRGERATMGKSLLDVQRELRIKAPYIAAIENADPDAFDTPGFIAGYVRSYARYLGMDPDAAFTTFCEESGFSVAHGMSAEASVIKKPSREDRLNRGPDTDIFARPATPFAPVGDSFVSRIEPSAIGSTLVLFALIGAIGFGGWSVLKEVQRVQVAPVDQTPVVLSDLDPLEGALARAPEVSLTGETPGAFTAPRADALDRLYRPQALDVPVLVARDAPIATLDPRTSGVFSSPALPKTPKEPTRTAGNFAAPIETVLADLEAIESAARPGLAVPQVLEGPTPAVQVVATGDTWVRIRAADGTNLFESVMKKGDTFNVPALEEPPILRTGESGSVYFVMNGEYYGPVGGRGRITDNLPLHQQALAELYEPATLEDDSALATMVAELQNAASSGD